MKQTFIFLLLSFFIPVFTLQGQWRQVGQSIVGEANIDQAGTSVSLSADGTVMAFGANLNDGNGLASGSVRVYQYSIGTWTKVGQDIDGEAAFDEFGFSINLSSDGSIIAIGAPYNDGMGNNAGHVRVYQINDGEWTQLGEDIDGIEGDLSGYSVSLSSDGTVVAVGAPWNNDIGNLAGKVRVYHYNSTWEQLGADINGYIANDLFGTAVSINANGSIVAIGAIGDGGDNPGSASVYQIINGVWTQIGQRVDGESAGDLFGRAISLNLNGNVMAVGAERNTGNGSYAGHARVYRFANALWTQIGDDIDGEANDWSGHSVSLNSDGTRVAIGSPWSSTRATEAGKVRVYQNKNDSWIQIGNSIDGNINDNLGFSVSLSADGLIVATGAPGHDEKVKSVNEGYVNIYKQCQTASTLNVVACNSYTVPSGDASYTVSGVYRDTIPNSAGCDSILTINLTINTVNVSVTSNDPVLIANNDSATYQWLDCNNNFEQVTGETSQSFKAIANGNYAVQISQYECVDTSACYTVLKASVIDNQQNALVKVFPTITSNAVSIECLDKNPQSIIISNITGKIYLVKTNTKKKETIDISNLNAGVYFVRIQIGDVFFVRKIIKD